MRRNEKLEAAIAASEFGNPARLAKALGVHYRNVDSYVLLERRPVDAEGIVKPDAAAMCDAMACDLTDLFPSDQIDGPYRFRESYADGYGRRDRKVPQPKYFVERELSPDQVKAVMDLLEFGDAVPPELSHGFAHILIRDLKSDVYEDLRAAYLDLGTGKENAARFRKAIRQFNASASMKRLQVLKAASDTVGAERAISDLETELRARNRVVVTDEIRSELQQMSERSGMGPHQLFDWAAKRNLIPPGKGISAQALDNALTGRSDTISEVLLEFAVTTLDAVSRRK